VANRAPNCKNHFCLVPGALSEEPADVRNHNPNRLRLPSSKEELAAAFLVGTFSGYDLFNHPNFRSPINYLTSPQFRQSTQMLGASLGAGGGLNPLYQIGGPRSAQIALKLLF
jgi:hypothetical protein